MLLQAQSRCHKMSQTAVLCCRTFRYVHVRLVAHAQFKAKSLPPGHQIRQHLAGQLLVHAHDSRWYCSSRMPRDSFEVANSCYCCCFMLCRWDLLCDLLCDFTEDRHGTAKMADFGLSCTSARSDSLRPQNLMPYTYIPFIYVHLYPCFTSCINA